MEGSISVRARLEGIPKDSILKHANLYFFLLIAIILSILSAQNKKVEANPINIAHSIAEKIDTLKISSTLDYYGYISQTSQNGYFIFTHPNVS